MEAGEMHLVTTNAEILGALRVHSWLVGGAVGEDAYSVFMAHSTAMGWASAGKPSDAPALWDMNEADYAGPLCRTVGLEPGAVEASGPDVLAAAQVAMRPLQRGLSIIALFECLGATVARLGSLDLTAIRLLVDRPQYGKSGVSLGHHVSSLNVFGLCDPAGSASANAVLFAGGAEAHLGPVQLEHLQRLNTGEYSFSVGSGGRLRIAMPEWSLLSAAWCASLLAHTVGPALFHPLRIEVRRTGDGGPSR
jgi:hypothetical protein